MGVCMGDQGQGMNPATVAAKLKQKGQQMTLTRTTPGVFDPVTGSPGTPTVQVWTVYGIMVNFSSLVRYGGSNFVPQTMVLSGDKQAKISAGVVVPLPGDVLHANGADWTIIVLDSVSPAGVDYLYNCHVRV